MNHIDQYSQHKKTLWFFWLDRYIDEGAKKFVELWASSPTRWQIRVNAILKRMEQEEGWVYPYLTTRLRENIALEVLRVFLGPTDSNLSSIVGDVYHHVDAISTVDIHQVAIEFVENTHEVTSKLSKTNNWYRTTETWVDLPLLVYHINGEFISRILERFEKYLNNSPTFWYQALVARLQFMIKEMIYKDKLPKHITSMHMIDQNWLLQTLNPSV